MEKFIQLCKLATRTLVVLDVNTGVGRDMIERFGGALSVRNTFIWLLLAFSFAIPVIFAPVVCAQSMMQQMAMEQEDNRMFTDMSRVSNWVNQYCIWNHRFPEQGDEFRDAKAQLNQLVPNNPYINSKLYLSQGLDADPVYAGNADVSPNSNTDYQKTPFYVPSDQAANLHRIQLVIDGSLSELEIQQWQTEPPDEWNAPAGTITVISNQQNLFCIWGAGLNGKPIRDPLSRQVQIIIGRYALLNFQE
jgi:hypothetical protein